MKKRSMKRAMVLAVSTALPAIPALADSGTWDLLNAGSASGSWSDSVPANWLGGTIASGAGFTADFSKLNITVGSTISLASSRTIGNIIFGDTDTTTNSGSSWTLSNGGNAANVLTLAGPTPTITINPLAASSLATISASIQGTDGLTKSGTGILQLTGNNSYGGGTTITAGELRAGSNTALGTGSVTVNSGARLGLNSSVTLGNTLFINGSTAIDHKGGTAVLTGPINLQSASTILFTSSAGSLEIQGDITLGANQLNVNVSSSSRPLILNGNLYGTGALNLANLGATTTISADNSLTFSGATSVARSTLAIGHNNALGTGTLVFGVNDQGSAIRSSDTTTRTVGNLFVFVGTGNSTYTFGSTSAAFNGDLHFTNTTDIGLAINKRLIVNNTTTFDAGFTNGTSAARNLTMETGVGTLILRGNSIYTGATNVNAGTLIVGTNGSGSLGNTAVTVGSVGVLGGNGSIGGAVNLNGGRVAPGYKGVGALTTGGLTIGANARFVAEFNAADNTADQLIVSAGSVTLDTTSLLELVNLQNTQGAYNQEFTLIRNDTGNAVVGNFLGLNPDGSGLASFNDGLGLAYTLDYSGGDGNDVTIAFTSVPEPGTVSVLSLAAMALLKRRRR